MGNCGPSKQAEGRVEGGNNYESIKSPPIKEKEKAEEECGTPTTSAPVNAEEVEEEVVVEEERRGMTVEDSPVTTSEVRVDLVEESEAVVKVELTEAGRADDEDKPRDELEAKLYNVIERARLNVKEKELHNAVVSLERTNELLRESHRRQARESAFELCSCITHLLVDGIAEKCESGKAERLLRNQRTICEKLQNANDLIDAERLAIEYQKYERETELEEMRFKYVEVKEKYDMQEGLHQKEQRAFESASQELKIKYEKHFKSLSLEIENLQRQCSMMEGTSRSQITKLSGEKEQLERDLEVTSSDLRQRNKQLETELASKGELIARVGQENTELNFVVDSMERNLVGLGDVGISDLLEEILGTSKQSFEEFSAIATGAVRDVKSLKMEVSRIKKQLENSQLILHALQGTLSEWRSTQKQRMDETQAKNQSLVAENKALTLKVLDMECEVDDLQRDLRTEKKTRAGYQEKYLMFKEATPDVGRPSRKPKHAHHRRDGSPRSDAGSVTDAYEAFYTPMNNTPLPFAETYSSPVRSDPKEEGELELLGQLDAQKTMEEVERQVYQLLKEESLDMPKARTTDKIAEEIILQEKVKLKNLMTLRKEQLMKSSKKKLESYLTT
ncbi:hypothetical protein A3770_18p82080 [Chloropicon primus]|uniref:Uncharacterized protein n=1 Tax=Chloropicon primus TaxID=1764295 RepID=A0A5B8N1H6_9CHLO|nr:hypothetical protein A3770_18p82080 [Chloropicon primus]|eukprot:QDZ25690.1 hypothetical protein A3770_18p82080 [Chloropicon primus]